MKGKPIEPGCLALIIGARYAKENIGRTVRVLDRKPPGWTPPDSPVQRAPVRETDCAWIVEVLPGQPLLKGAIVKLHTGQQTRTYPARQLAFVQKHLIRIDDDEEPRQEKRDTVSHKPKAEEVF